MIFFRLATDPVLDELRALSASLCIVARGRGADWEADLGRAIAISERVRSGAYVTFTLQPGSADDQTAIRAYRILRDRFPDTLELLIESVARGQSETTVEFGTLQSAEVAPPSHHTRLETIPRLLAVFRGHHAPH